MSLRCFINLSFLISVTEQSFCDVHFYKVQIGDFLFPFTQGFIRLSLWQTTAKVQSGGGALTWIASGIQGQWSSILSSISPLVILQALWLNGCCAELPIERSWFGPWPGHCVLLFNFFYSLLGLLGSPSVQTSEKIDSSQVRAFILSFLCLDCVYTEEPYIYFGRLAAS